MVKKKKRLTVKEKNKELFKIGKQLNHFGIVLRLYPNNKQQILINKTIGSARLVYNMYLNERQNFYKETGKTLTVSVYKKDYLCPMKNSEKYNFLKEVDKFALESSLEHLDNAYDRFFARISGFPNFKSKHRSKKSYTTKFTNNNLGIQNSFVKIPKLGLVEFNNSNTTNKNLNKLLQDKAIIKTATISQKANKYYISLLCEEIINIIKPLEIENISLDNIVGIDLGLTNFAIITNSNKTEKIDNPKYLCKSEFKLAKLQKRLSKKDRDSNNFIKIKNKVAKLHEHIKNQRTDFAHQLSRKLVNENQVVIVEDLNIKGMVKNKNLAKAISDAGWSRFINFLDYKLKNEGKYLIKVDRWFASSKICSNCGKKNIMLTLNEREWVCSICNTCLDRDINASINIRNEGLKLLNILAA